MELIHVIAVLVVVHRSQANINPQGVVDMPGPSPLGLLCTTQLRLLQHFNGTHSNTVINDITTHNRLLTTTSSYQQAGAASAPPGCLCSLNVDQNHYWVQFTEMPA